MKRLHNRRIARLGAVVLTLLAGVSVGAPVAQAHDPLLLEEQQSEPAEGPFLPDGRISFALYGTLLAPGDQRGFQFQIPQGENIILSLLIPDLAPENALSQVALPAVKLVRPDQTVLELEAALRVKFAEPFSRTNYVRLLEHTEIGSDGTYQVLISGTQPARFTVSIGYVEKFGTPVANVPNRNEGVGGVSRWYETPPPPKNIAVLNSLDSRPESKDEPQRVNPMLIFGSVLLLTAIPVVALLGRRNTPGYGPE